MHFVKCTFSSDMFWWINSGSDELACTDLTMHDWFWISGLIQKVLIWYLYCSVCIRYDILCVYNLATIIWYILSKVCLRYSSPNYLYLISIIWRCKCSTDAFKFWCSRGYICILLRSSNRKYRPFPLLLHFFRDCVSEVVMALYSISCLT